MGAESLRCRHRRIKLDPIVDWRLGMADIRVVVAIIAVRIRPQRIRRPRLTERNGKADVCVPTGCRQGQFKYHLLSGRGSG